MATIPLTQMKERETGFIIEIQGGHGFTRRMGSMNLRVGKIITKLGSVFMRGPVTNRVDNTQLALGFGMAKRIIVEVQNR